MQQNHKEWTSDLRLIWLSRCVAISPPESLLVWPALSLHQSSNHFFDDSNHTALSVILVRKCCSDPYVLPFRLYCQPAYPALMELLKSRYEQNLGGPAFVGACIPIRWEHDDKNLSNACRLCLSMHNNLRLWGWKKNTLRQERRLLYGGVSLVNIYKVSLFVKADWSILHRTLLQQQDKSRSYL